MAPEINVPEGHQVVGQIAWEAVDEVVAHLRQGGAHPVCQTRPRYVQRLTRHWHWRTEPETLTTTLAVPASEMRLAKRLLREWEQQENERIRPLLARLRGEAFIAILALGAVGTILWLIFRDPGEAMMYTLLAVLVALVFLSYWK